HRWIAITGLGTALVGGLQAHPADSRARLTFDGQGDLDVAIVDLHATEKLVLLEFIARRQARLAEHKTGTVPNFEAHALPIEVIALGDAPAHHHGVRVADVRGDRKGLVGFEELRLRLP